MHVGFVLFKHEGMSFRVYCGTLLLSGQGDFVRIQVSSFWCSCQSVLAICSKRGRDMAYSCTIFGKQFRLESGHILCLWYRMFCGLGSVFDFLLSVWVSNLRNSHSGLLVVDFAKWKSQREVLGVEMWYQREETTVLSIRRNILRLPFSVFFGKDKLSNRE